MTVLQPTVLILAAIALATPLQAQDTALEAKARAAFGQAIAEYAIPGMIVGVTRGGQHSFFMTGLAVRDGNIPVTPDTVFELGSISKIFTVTLAALAEQRGDLSLSDPVSAHVPQLEGSAAGALTLMDLATHHSGGLPLQPPEEATTTQELLSWLEQWQPPQPGARSYSNVSIGLLGHVTALAMGTDYADAVETVLFPALGLQNTWIDVPARAMPQYAFGYDRKTDAPIRVTPGVLDDEAYGVKSSATDMLRVLDAALGHGGLPSDLRAALSRTQEGQFQTAKFTQAMIWETYPRPADLTTMIEGNALDFILNPQPMNPAKGTPQRDVILNKTGSTNGFGGYVALVPQEDLGIVVLANRNYPNEARVRATHALIESVLADPSQN